VAKAKGSVEEEKPELAGLAQWFDLCENSLGDKTLQLGRENQIPSRVGFCIASDVRR
jgi:hypothetical protein